MINACIADICLNTQARLIDIEQMAATSSLMVTAEGNSFAALENDNSCPFENPTSGRSAAKIVNYQGHEVQHVFMVP